MLRLKKAIFSNPLVWYMIAAMMVISSVPKNADAAMITSMMASEGAREAEIAKVQAALESKVVSQRLTELGYDPEEVKAKVASFSDDDLHQLASNVDQLEGGGGVLGVVIALLIIVLLVVLILQVNDRKIVITK